MLVFCLTLVQHIVKLLKFPFMLRNSKVSHLSHSWQWHKEAAK